MMIITTNKNDDDDSRQVTNGTCGVCIHIYIYVYMTVVVVKVATVLLLNRIMEMYNIAFLYPFHTILENSNREVKIVFLSTSSSSLVFL